MNAEVLAIGDEITSGQLLDTNSQWLSQRLEELGVRVLYHSTVGDDLAAGVAVFRMAIQRADVVLVTGGLGPTADDLTREMLAQATDRPLLLVPEALEHVRTLFARFKREMPKQNELQALFPAGSRMIPNPHGTAPGIDLEVVRPDGTKCRVAVLPGVPAEMREMWHGTLLATIQQWVGSPRVICRRNLHCFGVGESQVEAMLPDLIRRGRTPRVGINASDATIILRIVAEGASEEECRRQIEPTAATIRQCLGSLVYGEGEERLQDVVVRLLAESGRTLATVEIGTAGLLAQWLYGVPGAAAACRGSLVAPQKGISPIFGNGLKSGAALASPDKLDLSPFRGRGLGDRLPPALRQRLRLGGRPLSRRFRRCGRSSAGVRGAGLGSRRAAEEIPFAIHPAIRKAYCGKHALNLLRLALLEAR